MVVDLHDQRFLSLEGVAVMAEQDFEVAPVGTLARLGELEGKVAELAFIYLANTIAM